MIYCHLITCFGWTWRYIDEEMTLPRLDAFTEYWKSNPPMHQMVATYLGYKSAEKKEPEKDMTLADLMSALGGGNG